MFLQSINHHTTRLTKLYPRDDDANLTTVVGKAAKTAKRISGFQAPISTIIISVISYYIRSY